MFPTTVYALTTFTTMGFQSIIASLFWCGMTTSTDIHTYKVLRCCWLTDGLKWCIDWSVQWSSVAIGYQRFSIGFHLYTMIEYQKRLIWQVFNKSVIGVHVYLSNCTIGRIVYNIKLSTQIMIIGSLWKRTSKKITNTHNARENNNHFEWMCCSTNSFSNTIKY